MLPVFLLLLVIAIDFGRLFFTYVQTTNAAREGANFAASAPTDNTSIRSHATSEKNAQAQRGEGLTTIPDAICRNQAGTVIACSLATGGAGAGNTVTVVVQQPFNFLTPLINNFFGGNLTLTSSATAIVLGYVPGSSATQPPACTTLPTATFSVIVTSGLTIFANPSGSTPNSGICQISGYNWDWGDTLTSVGTATGDSHTYGSGGTYVITLQVTNQAGVNQATGSVTVPVAAPTPTPVPTPTPTPPPGPTPTPTPVPTPTPTAVVCTKPVANFTWTTTGNGANKVYTYKDASTVANPASCPLTDWLWTFTSLGTVSNAQNPAPFSYGNSSTHPVTLTVTNAAGSTSITKNT